MGPGVMDSPPNGRSSDAQANQWPLGRLRHWLQRIQGNRQARNSAQDLRGAEAVAETHNRELQRSQAEATRLLERFRAFFATLPLAALIVDDKGLILEANQAAEQLFELPDDHLRRHLFTGLIDEADRDTAIEALSSDWETHRADLIEIGLHSVFGRPIVADLHIARLPGRLGGGHQSVCALVDRSQAVTQRRALREQAESLRHHRAELAERLKELGCLYDVVKLKSQPNTPIPQVLQQVAERLPAAFVEPQRIAACISLPAQSFASAGFVPNAAMLETPFAVPGCGAGWIRIAYHDRDQDAGPSAGFLPEEKSLIEAVAGHLTSFLQQRASEAEVARMTRLYDTLSATNRAIVRNSREDLLLAELCRITVERGGLAACLISRRDAQTGSLVPAAATYAEPTQSLQPPRASPSGEVEGLKLAYGLALPLRVDGELVGAKTVYATEPDFFTPDVVELLDKTAKDIAYALDHFARDTARAAAEQGLSLRERQLDEANRQLLAAQEIAQLGHWEIDAESGRVRWSTQIYRLFDLDPQTEPPPLHRQHLLLHPADFPLFEHQIADALATGEPFQLNLRCIRAGGAVRHLEVRGQARTDAAGRVLALYGTAQDVTDQHLADTRLRQAAKVFESTADAIIVTDTTQRILAVNRAFTEITGYTETDVIGESPQILQSDRRDHALFRAIWAVLAQTGSWRGELWHRRRDGEPYRARMTLSAVTGAQGTVTNYLVVFSDITSLQRSQERIDYLTHHDALTDLPNRILFRARLDHGLQQAERDQSRLAVMLLNLNRFKLVNESLGPALGDELLRQVAQGLGAALRPSDTLARLGGDEFGLVLEGLEGPHQAADRAQRLLELCAQPRSLTTGELSVTASLGISVYPSNGEDGETLLRYAGVALNRAKERGPNAFEFFEQAMETEAVTRLQLESD